MTFESFLDACSRNGQTVLGLCFAIFVVLGITFTGIVKIIDAVKNKNTGVEIEDDTDN